jgi:hypothetical protein
MADHGDQITVAASLDPDNAKAVLGVLVGDTLDQSRQHFSVGWMGLRLHDHREGVRRLTEAKRVTFLNRSV